MNVSYYVVVVVVVVVVVAAVVVVVDHFLEQTHCASDSA